MTTIRFSATSTASAATNIAVSLGGTPSVGDLVLVFLAVSNEIITHPPGWNGPGQWTMYSCSRQPSEDTLTTWTHTWNSSDSGSSVTFNMIPAPGFGVGDKSITSADAMAIAVVLAGPVGLTEAYTEMARDASTFVEFPSLKKAASTMFMAGYSANALTLPITGPRTNVATLNLGTRCLRLDYATARIGMPSKIVPSNMSAAPMGAILSVTDNPTFLYVTPFLEEGPVAENRLMYRYRLNRHYTVLNNSGVFSAVRYQSTDQINAATQVFVNNAAVTDTDRTNILNAGIGGEFIAA